MDLGSYIRDVWIENIASVGGVGLTVLVREISGRQSPVQEGDPYTSGVVTNRYLTLPMEVVLARYRLDDHPFSYMPNPERRTTPFVYVASQEEFVGRVTVAPTMTTIETNDPPTPYLPGVTSGTLSISSEPREDDLFLQSGGGFQVGQFPAVDGSDFRIYSGRPSSFMPAQVVPPQDPPSMTLEQFGFSNSDDLIGCQVIMEVPPRVRNMFALHQLFGVIVGAESIVTYISLNNHHLMRSMALLVYFGPDQPLLMFTGESFFKHAVNTGFCRDGRGQVMREPVPNVPEGAREQFKVFLNVLRDGYLPIRDEYFEVYPFLAHFDKIVPTAWERLLQDD